MKQIENITYNLEKLFKYYLSYCNIQVQNIKS